MSRLIPEVEFLTERALLRAGREQTIDVLIRITPPEPEEGVRRPPLNLGLVLDRSGSMGGAKIARAREAAAYCIDQLAASDRFSLVIYDDEIDVLVESRLAHDKAALKERLSTIQARNSTALHEAWVRGGMQVSAHLTTGAVNRVLLITDGLANVGLTNTDEIVSQAKGLAERGVTTSTIGIGDDFNENLLMPMAQSGGGNAWHVERPEDMKRIFEVELQGLLARIGHGVMLSLRPSTGAHVVDVLNDFPADGTGRMRIPDLQAGSPLEVVVELKVPAQAAGATVSLLELELLWVSQAESKPEKLIRTFEPGFISDEGFDQLGSNHEVVRARQFLINARARREAVALMDAGDCSGAQRIVSAALGRTRVACAPLAATPMVQEEFRLLADLEIQLGLPGREKSARKQLSYQSYRRSSSKPPA